ncbi:MAG: hypothetical protein ACPGVT_10980 [Maricaulaceae bacterium]
MTKRLQPIHFGEELAGDLISKHGPLISGEELWKTIGFTSAAAFRQAKAQDRLDIPVFSLPNRRGTFAFTRHVADWLRSLAEEAQM